MIRKYDSQGEVVYLILREPTTKYAVHSMKSLKFCSSKTSESNIAKRCILIKSNLVVFYMWQYIENGSPFKTKITLKCANGENNKSGNMREGW